MYSSYKPEDLDPSLQTTQLQQKAQQIRAKFDQRRGLYNQLLNRVEFIDSWDEIQTAISEFNQVLFTPWHQRWNNVLRANNHQQYNQFFLDGNKVFEPMEVLLESLPSNVIHSDGIEDLKSELIQNIEEDFLNVKADVSREIQKGIKDLLDLKSEIGLQKSFKDNIDAEYTSANKARWWFMGTFLGVLLLIPIFVILVLSFDWITSENLTEKLVMRGGITSVLSIVSYFLYKQFKLYQTLTLRYTHLKGFIGGGATYISQIINNEDQEVKRDINKRLAEMFMELDEVNQQAKQPSLPLESATKNTSKVIQDITNLVTKIKQG